MTRWQKIAFISLLSAVLALWVVTVSMLLFTGGIPT